MRIPIQQAMRSDPSVPARDGIFYIQKPAVSVSGGVVRVPITQRRIPDVRVAIVPVSGSGPRPNDCEWMVPLIGDTWTVDDPDGWGLSDNGDLQFAISHGDGASFRYADSGADVSGNFEWVVEITLAETSGVNNNNAGLYLKSGTDMCMLYYSQSGGDDYVILAMPDMWTWIASPDISADFDPYTQTIFLKMARVSGTVTGYWSVDGVAWNSIGSVSCSYSQIGVFSQIYWQNTVDFRMHSLTPCE